MENLLGRSFPEICNSRLASLCSSPEDRPSAIDAEVVGAIEGCRKSVPCILTLPMVTQDRGVVECKCTVVPLNDPVGKCHRNYGGDKGLRGDDIGGLMFG